MMNIGPVLELLKGKEPTLTLAVILLWGISDFNSMAAVEGKLQETVARLENLEHMYYERNDVINELRLHFAERLTRVEAKLDK